MAMTYVPGLPLESPTDNRLSLVQIVAGLISTMLFLGWLADFFAPHTLEERIVLECRQAQRRAVVLGRRAPDPAACVQASHMKAASKH